MKRILLSGIIMLCTYATFAQSDTTIHNNNGDTVMVGNFIIIKNHKEGDTNHDSVPPKREHYTIININKNKSYTPQTRPHSTFSTNYLIFDLGFANWDDKTDYTSAAAQGFARGIVKSDMKLITGKSSNVNLWLFMQKLNVTKNVLNLKYGLGLEMFNYRFKNNITFHDDAPYVTNDTIDFSKDKLYVGYATIPLMLNINAAPNRRHGFSVSAGVEAGYRIGSHTKQKSDERGKIKDHDDFDLNDWRFAYVAELGLGPVHLYGSYNINPLFKDGFKQYPYTIGIRFSNN